MGERVHEVIIVGSGAAGVFAAHALRGRDVCVVDVGSGPTVSPPPGGDLYALRAQRDMLADLIGPSFESIQNIVGEELSPKLKAPHFRFVTRRPEGAGGIHSRTFRPVVSYAEGGLANAWGAQVYRYGDEDLRGFPLVATDLDPYYDRVTDVVGISGTTDDLAEFHRSDYGLDPPLALTPLADSLLSRYRSRRRYFHARGLRIGRPRLAVLSRDRAGRAGLDYRNLEFFWPRIPAIYTPAYTLREMVAAGTCRYLPGHFARRFQETGDSVHLETTDLASGETVTLRARYLVLALGALNTPRLVLHSAGDTRARLPIVENPCSFTALLAPDHLGHRLTTSAYSSQLNYVYRGRRHLPPVIGMLYGVEGLLRSDLLFNFPLAMRGCLAAARLALPAMLLLQVFYDGEPNPGNVLGVDAAGNLTVEHVPHTVEEVESRLLAAFRRIGFFGAGRMVRRLEPGQSIHYGGSLPMRETPREPYETHVDGRLTGARRVLVTDSSVFPRLPAKNLTFTIMANAARVGDGLRARLEAGE